MDHQRSPASQDRVTFPSSEATLYNPRELDIVDEEELDIPCHNSNRKKATPISRIHAQQPAFLPNRHNSDRKMATPTSRLVTQQSTFLPNIPMPRFTFPKAVDASDNVQHQDKRRPPPTFPPIDSPMGSREMSICTPQTSHESFVPIGPDDLGDDLGDATPKANQHGLPLDQLTIYRLDGTTRKPDYYVAESQGQDPRMMFGEPMPDWDLLTQECEEFPPLF